MKVLSAFIFLAIIAFAQTHTYKCVFDKDNKDLRASASQNVPEVPYEQSGPHGSSRLLTFTPSIASRIPIRIYLDTLAFSNNVAGVNGAANTTPNNLNFILQSLNVAVNFYQMRLKTAGLSLITVPLYCVDFAPSNGGSNIANHELVIFAQYVTDASKSYGATGKSCDYVNGVYPDSILQTGRPSVGRIIFNTYTLVDRQIALTNRLFQSITSTTLHQITHILGFDSTLYPTFLDVTTGYNYSYNILLNSTSSVNSARPATSLLTTPKVLAWAQNYFNCSSLTGMLLQNQDGDGGGSHWERTAMYDELMTATSFGPTSKGMSGLTFALLMDMGWYTVDNSFSQTNNYGYQKGCSFLLDACKSNTSFSQFCDPIAQFNISYCQTNFVGKALCTNSSDTLSDGCGIYVPYFNCVDPASTDTGYQPKTMEVYGTSSFCLGSTFGTVPLISTLQSRCYSYVCGTSSITISIGSYSITCLATEAGVSKTLSALNGYLICPNFLQFCTVSRKTCTNWCSQNGYCTDGICNCITGTFGADCSQTSCTSVQYFNSLNNTCVSNCPSGTYQNIYSVTCLPCQSPCNQCITYPTNCLDCQPTGGNPNYFYNSTCYSTCPLSTYTSGYICVACDQAVAYCATCVNSSTLCMSCLNSLYLSQPGSGSCVATCTGTYNLADLVHMQCVATCPSNLIPSGSTCILCANGTYYFSGSCQPNCNTNCTVNCTSTYYPDSTLRACMLCNSACLTCNGPYPENCTSCQNASGNPYLLLQMCWAICPKGFYANPSTGKCQVCPVQLSCSACNYNDTTTSPYCTTCVYGTFYFTNNKSCVTSCNSSQYPNTWNNTCNPCDPSCATCNGPSSQSCLSCTGTAYLLINGTGGYCLISCPSVGYVSIGYSCQTCDSTCSTCNGVSSNQCSACQSNYYFYGGYCRYICPNGTYPDDSSLSCLSCDSSCSYCFNATASSCTSCSGSLFLYNFTCKATCPNGLSPNQWNVCFEDYFTIIVVLIFIMFST